MPHPETSRDEQLAARFTQLRRSELSDLPAPPTEAFLVAQAVEAGSTQRTSGPWRPGLAIAASVLFASVLLSQGSVQRLVQGWMQWSGQQADPAALYADVMAKATVTTDPLLQVSYSVAPEAAKVPGIFEFDLNPERWTQ